MLWQFATRVLCGMPSACTCKLDGVANTWAVDVEIVRRVSQSGRLFVAPANEELKACNKHCANNSAVLRPLLERMAEEPNWNLFSMDTIKVEYAARI